MKLGSGAKRAYPNNFGVKRFDNMVAAFTRYFLSLSFLVFYSALSFSQDQKTDTIRSRKDSLRNVALEKQSTELQQLKAAHEEDSLRKIQLQSELNSLKSTDNLKKSELLKQLTEIRTADSLRKAKQKKQIDSLKTFVKGFPVKPFLDTLFIVYSKQGSFTPAERAKAISERIVRLYEDFGFKPDSLQLNKSQPTVDLVYQDIIVTSVTEEDALWFNTTPIQLANKYKAVINKAVIDYRNETSWETLTKEIALSMLVIASWLVIVVLLSKLFNRLENKVKSLEGSVIKGIHIKRYELFDSKREVAVLINILTALKWILILITIYVALPVIFRIFPWTHNFSETLISYATDPLKKIMHAVWAYFPNLITIIILIVVFRYVIRFFHFLKVEVERGALKIPGFYADWANPTYQIIRILILAFMLIVIFPYMPGSDSPIFKGVSVFVGVLFTFGSAGALGNVVAGLVLTYMRAFKIGDRVKIGEVSGDIIEKSLLVTRLRTIKNEIISVPNSTVMNSHTVNYSSEAKDKGLILHTIVTIGYDVDWREVYKLLKKAASMVDLLEAEPEPFVFQVSLDDYFVSYQLNAYTKHPNKQAGIYSRLYECIQDTFHEAGIEIMSPHFYALRDGQKINIPEGKMKSKD